MKFWKPRTEDSDCPFCSRNIRNR